MELNNYNIKNILFIDIETVPIVPHFENLEISFQEILKKSYQKEIDKDETHTLTFEKIFERYGGIKSEYSKVVCIGMAYLSLDDSGNLKLTKKAIGCNEDGENEKNILEEFCFKINKGYHNKELIFCGHNIQEFDIPLLCRRMLLHGIKIPNVMNFQAKKPWDIKILDTMKLWAFGDYKNFTSLEILCHLFNIPTPKNELSGDKVKYTFYVEKNFKKIQQYCLTDVVATAQLLLKLNSMPLLEEAQIVF